MSYEGLQFQHEFNYELEFVSVDDLCFIVKRMEIEINQLQKHIDLFGMDDDDYAAWAAELLDKRERKEFLERRIKSRLANKTQRKSQFS